LYNEFEEHGKNGCVQNKMILKYAKNNGNWFRHFEDISKRCEPSDVVAYFLADRGYQCVTVVVQCGFPVNVWGYSLCIFTF